MRLLDRYILREQLLSLLAGLVFFVSVFIIVDVFGPKNLVRQKREEAIGQKEVRIMDG